MALQRAKIQARPSIMYLAPGLSCVLQRSWLWSSRRIRQQGRIAQSQIEIRKETGSSVQHELEYYRSVRVFMYGEDDQQMLQGRTSTRSNQNILQHRSNECKYTRYMPDLNEDLLTLLFLRKRIVVQSQSWSPYHLSRSVIKPHSEQSSPLRDDCRIIDYHSHGLCLHR